MNPSLKNVFDRVAALPDTEQQRYANWLQAELDDEREWDRQFSADLPMLREMADKAVAEDDRRETRPWPNMSE